MTPSPLEILLREQIQKNGPLPFADFMEQALYHPEWGYYASGRAPIGKKGDFFTSVSVGPLFGALIARQIHQWWEQLDRPTSWTLIEQGAHHGQLAHDLLSALRLHSPDCFHASSLALIEPFPPLQHLQKETLEPFLPKIRWYPSLRQLPPCEGVHYSNELLDAFPVHRVEKRGTDWIELRVDAAPDGFVWSRKPAPPGAHTEALAQATRTLPDAEEGFQTEVCLALRPWFEELSQKLLRGWVLLIDYGLWEEESMQALRREGTLRAYQNHQRHPNPLQSPGEIDLTAHVNLSAVCRIALEHAFHMEGFTDQHRFLSALGMIHFQDPARSRTPPSEKDLRAFQTLTHPQLLGSQFKVLCASKNVPQGACAGLRFPIPIPDSAHPSPKDVSLVPPLAHPSPPPAP